MNGMDRRTFLRNAALGSGALALGPGFWKQAFAAPAQPGTVYGALRAPDANGVRIPAGFTSRELATSFLPVGTTGYTWHASPDGAACFTTDDGGWIYVSNSEVPAPLGGVGALRFDKDGEINGAHRVIAGTNINCAGGPTPWGTWLTCEEYDAGSVYECEPGALNTIARTLRPGLGTFSHEAAAVDPVRKHVYLTEDEEDGRFYRFTAATWPDLRTGVLEAAELKKVANFNERDPRWTVVWHRIPNPNILPGVTFTRNQVPATTPFAGGEGCWYDTDHVYFTTKHDQKVWCLNAATNTMELIYDEKFAGKGAPLHGVDNVIVNKAGEIFVAEDGGDMQICVISADRKVEPLVQLVGHEGSEITGLAFSPDGSRLYFSSQRGKTSVASSTGVAGVGITYEVKGPFRGGTYNARAHRRLVSNALHNKVEPGVRGSNRAIAEVVHSADKALHRFGL